MFVLTFFPPPGLSVPRMAFTNSTSISLVGSYSPVCRCGNCLFFFFMAFKAEGSGIEWGKAKFCLFFLICPGVLCMIIPLCSSTFLYLHRHEIVPGNMSSYLYSNPSTLSPIAKQLVKPGLSIPSRFTHPAYPSSFRITKSLNPLPSNMTAPRGANLGRMPA